MYSAILVHSDIPVYSAILLYSDIQVYSVILVYSAFPVYRTIPVHSAILVYIDIPVYSTTPVTSISCGITVCSVWIQASPYKWNKPGLYRQKFLLMLW